MNKELPRSLGLVDSVAIVVGVIIGGGIFMVPNLVARSLPSAKWIMLCWAFAGVVSFFGALASAELGAALPATGGQYVFIRETYGRMPAFLCGWSNFVVARTAQVSWLAVTFALYVSYLVPLPGYSGKVLAIFMIVLFALVNYVGVTPGAWVQKIFAGAKLVGLAIIIIGAFLAKPVAAAVAPAPEAHITMPLFGVALIACLLSFDGWVQMSYVAGEIKRPEKTILRALVIGVSIVIAVYLLANLAYLRMLSIAEIAASAHVGANAAERALGPIGGTLVTVIILLSISGAMNGCFLTSPRGYFAQAQDGLFFRQFAVVHPRFQTPGFAILAQAAWAIILILLGTYDTLMEYALVATWLFYGLMVAGVIVLRRTRPELPRPYRMWGYPFTPALFVAVTLWFLVNTVISRPLPSLAALGLVAAGIPAYFIWRKT